MILKRRWFRILASLLALAAFVGYFLFSTLLFPPHEGPWKFDVAALVPRDVDFFAAKAGLRRDFGHFPRLASAERIEATEAWRTLVDSPEYAAFLRENGVEEALAQVSAEVSRLPLGLDPLSIFGGRDLALAGRFRPGAGLEHADWAVYGRVSRIGKLVVSLLAYPGLLPLEDQGIRVTREGDVFELSGGQLARALYVTRLRDVVVVGTAPDFAQQAQELALRAGQDSLLLSADYSDNVYKLESRGPLRDELELIVDLRGLLAALDVQGAWPDPNAERFLPSFMGHIFQAPACKKVMGTLGFEEGLQVDLFGGFSSELINDAQRRIYSSRGFDQDEVLSSIAALAPADCAAFVYLHGPIDELLKQVLLSVEPAMRANLQDAFVSTGRFGSLDEVLEDLSGSLRDRLALIVREVGTVDDTVPHDDQPVFNVTLVTWYSNEQKLVDLWEFIGQNQQIFGIQGHFEENIENFMAREFFSEFVPGTGLVAMLNTEEHSYITNNHKALPNLIRTYLQGGARHPRLSERDDFRALLSTCVPGANVLVWLNPGAAGPTLRQQAQRWAMDNVYGEIDWRSVRREEEQKVLPTMFPGKARAQLTAEEVDQLNAVVDPALREYRDRYAREHAPQLAAEKERQIAYLEGASAFLALLQLDPRSFRLSVRVVTPLGE